VELHVVSQLERVGETIFRHLPARGEIAYDAQIGIGAFECQQRRVVRSHRMDESEGVDGMTIHARRLGDHGEFQNAAGLWRLLMRRAAGG
jgi:hypothetical protein